MPPRRRAALAVLLIGLVTATAYAPSLSVPFQFDDYARIAGNRHLHAGNWTAAIGQLGGARLLPAATLVLNYRLSGEDTLSYHVVNLAIHLAATAAVFWLAWLLVHTPRVSAAGAVADPVFFAATAATLFACHPLQTQAVTYIVQRAACMSALFYVSSVAAYLAGRLAQRGDDAAGARRYFPMALLCAVAALLSKENAVTLPLAIVLAELACFGRRRIGSLLKVAVLAAPILALPVVWKVARSQSGGGAFVEQLGAAIFAQGAPGGVAAATPLSYFLTQMLVVPHYLRLLLLPIGLNIDHDVRVATRVDAEVLGGAALLVLLMALGVWALRRAPLIGFGILWFFVALSVESSFLPIHDVMMEHRMYLAMPGAALVFAALLCRLRQHRPRLAMGSLIAVVALLSTLTLARNRVWLSAVSLWSDAAAKSPHKARVQINAGVAYHGTDQLDDAIRHYCRALEIDPEIGLARDNIEIALEQQGRLREMRAHLRRRGDTSQEEAADVSDVVCAAMR